VIDSSTQLVGLIGWPVEHSLSPVMHNAVFEALALDWCYVPLPVPPGHLEAALRGLAALGFCGANVTVPHKHAMVPLLSSVSPEVAVQGAVNTLVIGRDESGKALMSGYNTDSMGFVGALRQGGFEPEDGGEAVVVGAGGAARAVVSGLLSSGMEQIWVLNRTLEHAQALISDLGKCAQCPSSLSALPLTRETLVECTRTASLLVQSTTVGMWPHGDGSVWPEGVPIPSHLTVFDLVYNPLETRLLQQARESGARTIDGLGMLVRQGALSFDLWTNQSLRMQGLRMQGLRMQGLDIDEIAVLMRAACERVVRRERC
jgi:shikimate dehydrogenase